MIFFPLRVRFVRLTKKADRPAFFLGYSYLLIKLVHFFFNSANRTFNFIILS